MPQRRQRQRACLPTSSPTKRRHSRACRNKPANRKLYAGLQFPKDYSAGLDLGKKVAARVIEGAKADGSDAVWTGTVPTGKCMWVGANPGNVTATTGSHSPLVPRANSGLRRLPPAIRHRWWRKSPDVKNFPRSPAAFATNQRAMYWQSPEGLNSWPYVYANKWMFEDKLEQNAPRWARVYALIAVAFFDAFIASQDGKFTYWYIRPPQLEPAIVPAVSRSQFPELSFEPFHVLGHQIGDAGLSLSAACRRSGRLERRPEIPASGPGYTIRSITWPVWRWAKRSSRNSSRGRMRMVLSKPKFGDRLRE